MQFCTALGLDASAARERLPLEPVHAHAPSARCSHPPRSLWQARANGAPAHPPSVSPNGSSTVSHRSLAPSPPPRASPSPGGVGLGGGGEWSAKFGWGGGTCGSSSPPPISADELARAELSRTKAVELLLSTRARLFGSGAVAPQTATLWLPKPRAAAAPVAAEALPPVGRTGRSHFSPSAAATPQRHSETAEAFRLRATAGHRKLATAQMVATATAAATAAAAAATPDEGCLVLASGLAFRTTEEGLCRHFGCSEVRPATRGD